MKRLCIAAAAVLLVLTGCGGSSETPSTTETTSSGPASATSPSASADAVVPDPCTLFTDQEITDLTGRAVTQRDTDGAQPTEPVRWCQWQLDGGQLLLTLQQTTTDEFVTAQSASGDAIPVDGVGEQAFTTSGHLYALSGPTQVDVYFYGADSDEQNLAEAEKVALAVIPKL